ncbi:uncharacterized protein [Euwallacea similis]|uniref:uncharacterized protein n=1 Tax=Euwallacea similis TaxID=1736056 RepID=UPI00344FE014
MTYQDCEEIPSTPFTVEEVSSAVGRSHNWRALHLNGAQDFWLKRSSSSHQRLTTYINEVIADPRDMPRFPIQKMISLLLKGTDNIQDPSKYGPSTYLPTLYKLITLCITQIIYTYCERNNIIAIQQALKTRTSIWLICILYKRAFDLVPHVWLIKVLNIYRLDPAIINLLKYAMKTWRTRLRLTKRADTITIEIYTDQEGRYGFAVKNNNMEVMRGSHLLYMVDLNLVVATKQQSSQILSIVERFSEGHGDAVWLRQMLHHSSTVKNLFHALDTYAYPVFTYSFGIVKWSVTYINNLKRKVRTFMMRAREHHPKSAVQRITLPRPSGERGLTDLKKLLDQLIINLRRFFHEQAETSAFHRSLYHADNETLLMVKKRNIWPRHPDNAEKVVLTRNYVKHVIRDAMITNAECRYECNASETIQHNTGDCQAFAGTKYNKRHNSAVKILHRELTDKLELRQADRISYYEYASEPILESESHRLPDIILVNKTLRHAALVDIAIPNDNNLVTKRNEKIHKYRDLQE